MCFSLGLGYLFSSCQTSVKVSETIKSMTESMTRIVKKTKLIHITSGNTEVTFNFYVAKGGLMKCGNGFNFSVDINADVTSNVSAVNISTTNLNSYLNTHLNTAIKENSTALAGFLASVPTIKTTTNLRDTITHITNSYMTDTHIYDLVTTNVTRDTVNFFVSGIIEAKECNVTLHVMQQTLAMDLISNLTKVYDTNKTISAFRNKYTGKVSVRGKGIGGIVKSLVSAFKSLVHGLVGVVHSVVGAYAIIVIVIVLVVVGIPVLIIILIIHHKKKQKQQLLLINTGLPSKSSSLTSSRPSLSSTLSRHSSITSSKSHTSLK